tara:strand:+ start:3025 stop:4149 length:1125 start_codon:yes stop_codon:yes gene_type:complete
MIQNQDIADSNKEQTPKTVVVGMSGGVDSSVAALLLKQQGYRVIGLFMKNWEETSPDGTCTAAKDYDDVAWTCAKLDIPFYGVNFVDEYRESVFQRFIGEYKKGRTPNPDILCNREIKFKVFFEKAMSLGADYLATGHYCQTDGKRVIKSVDQNKDQSYFLSGIDGKVLKNVLFPIGDKTKNQIRKIAQENNLPTKDKKDSTGICFIGERKFRPFLKQYVQSEPGDFCRLDGSVVGRHHGCSYYTLGQRKQLGLGGPGDRWYVVKKEAKKNIVFVERGDHAQLYCKELELTDPSWITEKPSFPLRCMAKIRYRQEDQSCQIVDIGTGQLRVFFEKPQRAAAPGQVIAFYQDEQCLGCAVIDSLGPSEWEKNNRS